MKKSSIERLDFARNGLLFAFMGLPGCGKSTTAKSLANLVPTSEAYLEPEEQYWPIAVTERERFGCFTAITWFRSMRVPLLWSADAARRQGKIAIVDSYYDKLFVDYIDHPPMRWLLPQDDPYFDVAKQLATVDQDRLPNVDHLIFLRVTESQWRQLLRSRGRSMDKEHDFLASFPSQDEFLHATELFTRKTGTHLIVHDQQLGSAEKTAQDIFAGLVVSGVFPSRNA